MSDYVPVDGSYASAATSVIKSRVTDDYAPRWQSDADGRMQWGDGGTPDCTLKRMATAEVGILNCRWRIQRAVSTDIGMSLYTTGEADLRWRTDMAGRMQWGDGGGTVDTILYRGGGGYLRTDGVFGTGDIYLTSTGTAVIRSLKGAGLATAIQVETLKGDGSTPISRLEIQGGADATSIRIMNDTSLGLGGSDLGGGKPVIFMGNVTTVPNANPVGGGVVYSEAGSLKYRGSNGTVTVLAPA